MNTTPLRERFNDVCDSQLLGHGGNTCLECNTDFDKVFQWVESEIANARKEERSIIKEKAEKLKREITICKCGPGEACDKCPRQKDVDYNFALEHVIQSLN